MSDPADIGVVSCPQETPHDGHDYVAPGIDDAPRFYCPGVSDKRSGDDRRAWDHPQYYGGKDNPYEAIKVIDAWELGFCLGNAVKYISRAGKKDPAKKIEDLEKAIWYLQHEVETMRGGIPG